MSYSPLYYVLVTVLIVIGIIVIVAVVLEYRRAGGRLDKKRARIADRASIPINQIYQRFYAGTGLIESDMMALWLEVGRTLELDPEKMRPSDRFDREYASVPGYPVPDELDELEDIFHCHCEQRKIEYNPESIETLDDYIRILSREKHARNAANS